jgi:hypothetical protein
VACSCRSCGSCLKLAATVIASVRKLKKEISTDIDRILAARLRDFERNFWSPGK